MNKDTAHKVCKHLLDVVNLLILDMPNDHAKIQSGHKNDMATDQVYKDEDELKAFIAKIPTLRHRGD